MVNVVTLLPFCLNGDINDVLYSGKDVSSSRSTKFPRLPPGGFLLMYYSHPTLALSTLNTNFRHCTPLILH